jgi:hypothetical protein
VAPPSGPAEPPVIAPPVAPADLSKIPGNLVGASTCKVVRTSPKKRSARIRGVGRVTFATTVPQRVTAADPLVLTLKAGKHRLRSVTYRVGRRTVGRSRRAPFRVAVKPRSLSAGGTQVLTALVRSRKKEVKQGRLAIRLNVALCPSLLTAGVRFTGGRAVTQMRLFSRTSIQRGTLTLPAKLVPPMKAGKRAGTLTLTGIAGRPVAKRLVASSRGRLLGAPQGVAIRRAGRNVTFSGIPAGTGILQLDLFGPRKQALRLLRGKKAVRFTAKVRAERIAQQRLLAVIKPARRR